MKRILLSAVVLSAVGLNAQAPAVKTSHAVGVETSEPRATLDINGDARLQKAELMTTSTSTEEVFPDCPCVLTIDKYGVIKRIPKSKFVFADGSSAGAGAGSGSGAGSSQGSGSGSSNGNGPGGGTSGNPGGGQGSGSEGSQGGSQGGNNQSTGGANLGTGVRATIKDVDDYVVSSIYNGYQLQGKIDNNKNKVVVNIPYTNGNGEQYNEATSTTTTTAVSSADGHTSPITMTIKGGTLSSGAGNITAEITTPQLYKVKKLAPGEVEIIAEFKYTVNNKTRKVVLKAVGGVPDKQFSVQTNGKYKHRFVYLPVTVKMGNYKKTWLNQNLGAEYANIDGGHFNPNKIGGDDEFDTKAYGSLFQWGRVDNTGYELMNWEASGDKRLFPDAPWFSATALENNSDPCPNGYHTPSKEEWQTFDDAVRASGVYVYREHKLKLSPAGYRHGRGGAQLTNTNVVGYYWSSIPYKGYGYVLRFATDRSIYNHLHNRGHGASVRCIKND